MSADPRSDPWSGVTYNGFSGPASQEPRGTPGPRPAGSARRPSTRTLLLGGVGAALALGVLFGALAKPDLKTDSGPARAPMAAVTQPGASAAALAQPGADPQMTIEVNQPPPGAAPVVAGKLEVLPPDLARQARQQQQAGPAPRVIATAPTAPTAPLPTVTYVTPPPAVQAAPLAVPPPRYRASFDCGAARPGAEQMVCSDPDLAAADRQLAQAYRRALQSGAPTGALRADQQDWLDIREDAARHGRGAVASIYNQRIDELNEAAQDGY